MSVVPSTEPVTMTSIIDNREGNTLQLALESIGANARELCIATAFFSLDALNLIGEELGGLGKVRILFGDEASKAQRKILLDKMRQASDGDLLRQRNDGPLLDGLRSMLKLIEDGRLEARCYTKEKFHAKAYISHLATPEGRNSAYSIVGSGNFTAFGLRKNIELNVELHQDQTGQLIEWYEARWAEAEEDDVTLDLKKELERHLRLHDPFSIYVRALLEWGDWVQGRQALSKSIIVPKLDPHQEDGFRQALNVIKREGGAMICDGVGLGKSYIALALIEHALQRGESVLLFAPRAILDASWEFYFHDYLRRYTRGFNNLKALPITWLAFRPEPTIDDFIKNKERRDKDPNVPTLREPTQAEKDLYEDLDVWAEQAQLVIIDESHNLRSTDANRYINALRLLQPKLLGRKKVVLLTATPLNTDYGDVTAQFRLICLENGTIGGVPLKELQAEAVAADRDNRKDPEKNPSLFDRDVARLNAAMHTIAIQRSRATCKLLAEKRGKKLRFPEREGIAQISFELSPLYASLVEKTRHDFEELAKFIKAYRDEVKRAAGTDSKKLRKRTLTLPKEGLRFSAYLPDRYRREESDSLRDAQVESFLVSLVFINVMKQLESSIHAFEGILRSLGAGLCARLHHVFGEDVAPILTEHLPWVRDGVRHLDSDDEAFEYDPAGLAGDDSDYLQRLQGSLKVHKSLADFNAETHDVKTWREHIESDLRKLREIHERAVLARDQGEDRKLEEVAAQVASQRYEGRKVLIFTQSVRTADYLYRELPNYMPDERIERITAEVQGRHRHELLHAFSPRYNPLADPPLEFKELGVLICTDVLSEGVNLQEAGCILNYDLHWNPVRLIQRIGRVDRRLRDDDPGHAFSILNVLPPKEIEKIINLVGTVEGRKRKILRLLGLDQSFFSADDEAGTLQEFNKMVEGDTSPQDQALADYGDLLTNQMAEVDRALAASPGAFGVWETAPFNGAFGLFKIALNDDAPEVDRARFASVIGQPILVLQGGEAKDAPDILAVLAKTVKGETSGKPAHSEQLKTMLYNLRRTAVSAIPNRTQSVTANLVCWMQLRSPSPPEGERGLGGEGLLGHATESQTPRPEDS